MIRFCVNKTKLKPGAASNFGLWAQSFHAVMLRSTILKDLGHARVINDIECYWVAPHLLMLCTGRLPDILRGEHGIDHDTRVRQVD